MITRGKLGRVATEHEILRKSNHPFILSLATSFQSSSHIFFITHYCLGGTKFQITLGELYQLLQRRVLDEADIRFYTCECICALEYLHLSGFIYRDLKPESSFKLTIDILINGDGHIVFSDFDLSITTPSMKPKLSKKKSLVFSKYSQMNSRYLDTNTCVSLRSNSFVGTEEYLCPEIIRGTGHSSMVDWWTLGILIYEMVYGFTPFKGGNRMKTFINVLNSEPKFWKLRDPIQLPPATTETKHKSYPLSVGSVCIDLIRKILVKNEKKRLGAKGGAGQIKGHLFFKGDLIF